MFNIYLSHYIPLFEDICPEYVKNMSNVGQEIKAYLIDWQKMDGFPKITLCIPADYMAFTLTAWDLGFLEEDNYREITNVWIKAANLIISFGKHTADNMREDIEIAQRYNIPIYHLPDLTKNNIESLKVVIKLLLGDIK